MPYYENLEKAKLQLSIINYLHNLGSKKCGRFYDPCPICGHRQHFMVYEDQNRFSAFGCGKHGSIVDLIALCENMKIETAILEVLKRTNNDPIIRKDLNKKASDIEDMKFYVNITFQNLSELYKMAKEMKLIYPMVSFEFQFLSFLEMYADRITHKIINLDYGAKNSTIDTLMHETKTLKQLERLFDLEYKNFIDYFKQLSNENEATLRGKGSDIMNKLQTNTDKKINRKRGKR